MYIKWLQEKTTKPLIISEFGWPNPIFEIYSDKYQSKRIKDYINIVQNLPIKEAYYFKLLDDNNSIHKQSGIITKDWKKHKPSYNVFRLNIIFPPKIKSKLELIITKIKKNNSSKIIIEKLKNLAKQKPKYKNIIDYIILNYNNT